MLDCSSTLACESGCSARPRWPWGSGAAGQQAETAQIQVAHLVHEEVGVALARVRDDEAEALLRVEPLDGAGREQRRVLLHRLPGEQEARAAGPEEAGGEGGHRLCCGAAAGEEAEQRSAGQSGGGAVGRGGRAAALTVVGVGGWQWGQAARAIHAGPTAELIDLL